MRSKTTTLKYSQHSEKTMQSTKTTIILTTAILILTLLTAGCLKPDADGDGYADEIDDFPNDPRYNSDNDQDGAMDKVAVKYVGWDDVLEFEAEYQINILNL